MERMKTIFICVFLFKFIANSSSETTVVSSSGCNYCMSKTCTPTVLPAANFDAKKDKDKLLAAVRSKGAQDTIIDILTSRSDSQRMKISMEYVTTGTTLLDDIKRSLDSEMQVMLEALMKPLPLFFVEEINDAIRSDDSEVLFEILGSLPNCAIREISFYYRLVNKVSLTKDLGITWFSYHKSFLYELAKGDRNESEDVDVARAKKDASDLANSIKSWMSMQSTFIRVFTKNSFPQLRKILEHYNFLRKNNDDKYLSIMDDVKKNFKEKLKVGLLIVIRNVLNQHEFFASELYFTLSGLVPDLFSRKMIRIIRSRCEVDLEDIKEAFKRKYQTSLAQYIEEDTTERLTKGLNAVVKK